MQPVARCAMTRKLVFFDIETGGIDPKRHPIIQLAAIAVDERLAMLEAFEAKIQFDVRKAKAKSLRKNHYHPGVWSQEACEPLEAAHDFAAFLRRHATVPALSGRGGMSRLSGSTGISAGAPPADGSLAMWCPLVFWLLEVAFT